MGKLSEHFNRSEFACNCGCGFDTVDAELLRVLEDLRNHFKEPVHINSGCRCRKHNIEVKGSEKSQHLTGRAADIVVKNHPPEDVQYYLQMEYPDRYGIGTYRNFTHIDTRGYRVRWN